MQMRREEAGAGLDSISLDRRSVRFPGEALRLGLGRSHRTGCNLMDPRRSLEHANEEDAATD